MPGGVHSVRHQPPGADVTDMAGGTVGRLHGGATQIVHPEGRLLLRGEEAPFLRGMGLEVRRGRAVASFAADAGVEKGRLCRDRRLRGGMRMAGDAGARPPRLDPEDALDRRRSLVRRGEGEVGPAVGILAPVERRRRSRPLPLLGAVAADARLGPLEGRRGRCSGRSVRGGSGCRDGSGRRWRREIVGPADAPRQRPGHGSGEQEHEGDQRAGASAAGARRPRGKLAGTMAHRSKCSGSVGENRHGTVVRRRLKSDRRSVGGVSCRGG